MRCRHCGAAVRPGVELCSNCGASVGRRRQGGYVVCRHCGRRVRAAGSLCPACGARLRRSWRPVLLIVLAIALVGAGYYVLTRVVTIGRIQQQVTRLPTISLAAILPPGTPTATRAPIVATATQPVPTRIPTTTPVLTATLTPISTATPTASPAPTRRPATPTPTYAYPAVELTAPANGVEIAGAATTISLTWKPAGTLAEGDGYAITLRYEAADQTQTVTAWVREASWRVPAELYDKLSREKPSLEWSVRVARGSYDGVALSPAGQAFTFTWQ